MYIVYTIYIIISLRLVHKEFISELDLISCSILLNKAREYIGNWQQTFFYSLAFATNSRLSVTIIIISIKAGFTWFWHLELKYFTSWCVHVFGPQVFFRLCCVDVYAYRF